MKKLFVIAATIISFTFVSTSCSKSGCPMQITKEMKFDKEVKIDNTVTAFVFVEDCNN
ncbi:MAG: hypothetical protein R2728_06415 [Chitinophagales bacterium]